MKFSNTFFEIFLKKNAMHIEVVWAVCEREISLPLCHHDTYMEREGGKVQVGGEKDLKETKKPEEKK